MNLFTKFDSILHGFWKKKHVWQTDDGPSAPCSDADSQAELQHDCVVHEIDNYMYTVYYRTKRWLSSLPLASLLRQENDWTMIQQNTKVDDCQVDDRHVPMK